MDWSGSLLSFLAGVTFRSIGLLLLATAAVLLPRVRSAAARHAVCAVTVAGMLLLAVISPLVPPLPVRVMSTPAKVELPAVAEIAPAAIAKGAAIRRVPLRSQSGLPWRPMAAGIYLAGAGLLLFRLLLGYFLTVRLVRASRPVREPWACEVLESDCISVPLTAGWLRPRILMPSGWRAWDSATLQAVLVHEQTHIQRRDWLVAMLAGVNRCLFWFHPAAWWLEGKLAALAEQACDDGALLQLEGRQNYAQALLNMASQVKRGDGRLTWEAMAMAKASEVGMRIDRILDETRQIPRGLTRLYWVALAAGSLPLIYFVSVAQLAPAMAQERPAVAAHSVGQLDFGQMEQYVAAHPDDLEVRGKLIRDYFLYSIVQPRLNHIYWMIQNHPESELTALNSTGILPRTTPLMNTEQDYQTAASLWRAQVAIHAGDARVQANAARFLAQNPSEWDEAERLLTSARSLDGGTPAYTQQLARLYATAMIESAGGFSNIGFAEKAKSELYNSTDGLLLLQTANQLNGQPGLADLRTRLLARSQMFGVRLGAGPREPAPMAATVKPFVPTVVRVGGNVQQSKLKNAVQPVYPQAARDAGIEGTVELSVLIGRDGTVKSTDVTAGNPILAAAAQEAVMQWTYSPTLLNAFPVEVKTTVQVPFRLQ